MIKSRREFLQAAALAGGAVAVGGAIWGQAAYARRQLTQKLMSEALPELTQKEHAELLDLPVKGREEIRTWFHAPCLNSTEFVYEVCSNAFVEKLSACKTDYLKELCFLNAFVGKVVSQTEILNRVQVIAEEIGGKLDRNWATCCQRISAKWDIHVKTHGSTVPVDFTNRMEPFIRTSLDEAVRSATVAGQRPAIGDTIASVGKSALLILPLRGHPAVAIPLFALLALRHLFTFVMGVLNSRVGEYQRAISERLSLLGNRIGSEFEAEIRSRVEALHGWQEAALRKAAESQARDAVSIL